METDNIVAFIPVRGGSKSIPLKNIKEIYGRPLVYWVLDACVNCALIDEIFVSTDSEEIKLCIERYPSKRINVINRTPATATDTATTESAMLEFAKNYRFNKIILVQATSPLLRAGDIAKGIKLINNNELDSVISVVEQKRFIWKKMSDKAIKPVNYNPDNRPRRQDFKGFLVENGAFYITYRKKLLKSRSRFSGEIGFIIMPTETYYEIDEVDDWIIVEEFLRRKNLDINC